MRGEYRKQKLAAIKPEDVAAFCERRYKLMTSGTADICAPATAKVSPHAPFTSDAYPYRDHVGNIQCSPWKEIRELDCRKLVHPNPFELSAFRSHSDHPCFRIWDSSVAIPASRLRGAVREIKDIQAVRHCNTHWLNGVAPALQHTGPLGHNRALVRPAGPGILDLTRMDPSWASQLFEAAHVLAHLRGDTKSEYRLWAGVTNRTEGQFRAALSEIVFSLWYDVPLDVTDKDRGRKGEPDTYFNTELKTSSYIKSPAIRLPWNSPEAARFDETLSVMLLATFIEPVPFGFVAGNGKTALHDRWTGMPTMVILCGWEGMDYISHAAVGASNNSPIDYIVRAEDLLEPDTYWYYLWLAELACKQNGDKLFAAIDNGRWMYFHDWILSPVYQRLLSMTPPLPCLSCIGVNQESEGAPERPKGPRPTGAVKAMSRQWQQWFSDQRKIHAIARTAMVAYETMLGNIKQKMALWRSRTAAHNRKMAEIRRQKKMERAVDKLRVKGIPGGKRDQALITEWMRTQGATSGQINN